MAAIVTLDDLAGRLGVELTDLDYAKAQLAIGAGSGIVRVLSGPPRQDIEFVSQETVTLRGGLRVLTLPQRPVVIDGDNPLTVVEVGDFGAVDFVAVDGRDFEVLGNELTRGYPYRGASRLQGWPLGRPLGTWANRVRVTYSHGYMTIPDEIKALALDIALMQYENPLRLRSVRIDDYSEDYAVEALGQMTVEGIRAQLSGMGYRRGAHSIHLG